MPQSLLLSGKDIICEAYDSGYYLISRLDSEGYLASINGKWLVFTSLRKNLLKYDVMFNLIC